MAHERLTPATQWTSVPPGRALRAAQRA